MNNRTSKTVAIILAILVLAASSVQARNFVLILDPGHGGKDYGAIGKITNEKTINLKVAKLVGEKIARHYDDVDIVYTRNTDKFVSLKDRAAIANTNQGDLFISIHVNSISKKARNRTTINGASVYTLGLHKSADNLEVAKRENAVMAMEDDYNSTYEGFNPESSESYIIFELSQNQHMEQSVRFAGDLQNQLTTTAGRADKGDRQAGFWVLWSTGMPSVLIELDFICNPEQEKFLASEAGQNKMADAIVNAFATYKSTRANLPLDVALSEPFTTGTPEGHGSSQLNAEADNAITLSAYSDENNVAENENTLMDVIALTQSRSDQPVYMIQFLTASRELSQNSPELKGLRPVGFYLDNGLYKFTFGSFNEIKEAKNKLNEIQKLFPSAFIIRKQNGKRIK